MKLKLHVTQEINVEADTLEFAKELIIRDPPWSDRAGVHYQKGMYTVKTGKVIKVVRKKVR